MKSIFSTYQASKFCNTHHTTIINWIKQGKLRAYTTPGGHRRVKRDDLVDFMRKYEIPIPDALKERQKTILIIDNDPRVLDEFKEALKGSGFDLYFATDGFQAGRMIYRGKPDLVFLDFKTPGMDGFQVCELLRNDEETSDIPIIAITSPRSEEEQKRIREYGIKKQLPTPIKIDKLLDSINKILDVEDADKKR